jgi:hypothetical protein
MKGESKQLVNFESKIVIQGLYYHMYIIIYLVVTSELKYNYLKSVVCVVILHDQVMVINWKKVAMGCHQGSHMDCLY